VTFFYWYEEVDKSYPRKRERECEREEEEKIIELTLRFIFVVWLSLTFIKTAVPTH